MTQRNPREVKLLSRCFAVGCNQCQGTEEQKQQNHKDQMKKLKCYRQGDVMLVKTSKLELSTAKAKKVNAEAGRIILAHGEVTGHHHSIDADQADWWKNDAGVQFLDVPETADLVHQEHSTITLEPGTYKVVRQREYSHEAIRNVAD